MQLLLAMALLAAKPPAPSDELPTPAPPLVEAEPEAIFQSRRTPVVVAETSPEDARARVLATSAVAAGLGALLVGAATALWVVNPRDGSSPILLFLSIPAALFVGSTSAAGVHRKMGGQGGIGAHLAGGAMGGLPALLLAGVVLGLTNGRPKALEAIGCVFGMSVLFGTGVGLMGELSHVRTLQEEGLMPEVSVAPLRDGALVSARFRL